MQAPCLKIVFIIYHEKGYSATQQAYLEELGLGNVNS